MGKFAGTALRFVESFLYFLAFCCAAIVLGFYSYFLSVEADRNERIPTWEKAVEGISGAAVLYTLAATLLTCCLGGVTVFAFLGLVLDVLFGAAFIALAVLTRDGAHSCTGSNVRSPLGNGDGNSGAGGFDSSNITYSVKIKTACRFNKACFIVSIIGAFLFFLAAAFQLVLGKHHKKEKRYGPGPDNGYTSGSAGKRKFWQRKPKNHTYTKDAEAGALAGGVGAGTLAADRHVDTRPSHDTAFTGSTVTGHGAHNTYAGNKYDPAGTTVDGGLSNATNHTNLTGTHATHGLTGTHATNGSTLPTHGTHGYHTAPTGTAVNPYGYENGRTAATNY